MKLVWLTDPHFHTTVAWGMDLARRLDAAIDHVRAHQADADLCVLTGDLTNDGDAGIYAQLRGRLDRLPMRWLPLVGNHDRREPFVAALTPPAILPSGHVQYEVDSDAGVLLCLDTLQPGTSVGEMARPCLDWLAERLDAHAERDVYIFMHHPPALTHTKFDDIGLSNREAFLDIVGRHRRVRHIFAGHVHRRVTGHVRGIPFSTMSAIAFQAPGPGAVWKWGKFIPNSEPPAYGVVHITDDGVTIHSEQFCDADFARLPASGEGA